MIKILLLEDDPTDAELVQRALLKDKLPCDFRLSMNRASFMEALQSFVPDIILSDHALPQFDSFAALTMARQYFPGIPFILVTGSVSEEFAAGIIKSGADDYILKDRMSRLPLAIETALERRRILKEKEWNEQQLIQSGNNLRTIFESTTDGFLLIDKDLQLVAFNMRAAAFPIFNPGNAIREGDALFDAMDPAWIPMFETVFVSVLAGETLAFDHSSVTASGRLSWIDFSVTPVEENGAITGACIVGRDISEKKQAEQQKEFDSNNLKALINNTDDLIWSVNTAMELITCNDAFKSIVNQKSVAEGSDPATKKSDHFATQYVQRYREQYQTAFSGRRFTFIDHFDAPEEHFWEVSFHPISKDQEVVGTACFSRNITERKKTEKKLQALDKKVLAQKIAEQRKITRAILKAEEEERNRLGRELHDNISQILAASRIYLSFAAKKNENVAELIRYPLELIDNSIEELRLLSHKQVTQLKNIDLEEFIRKVMGDFSQKSAASMHLHYNIPGELISDEIKLNIYRIIQEQLNNILKHAQATEVKITLQVEKKCIRLTTEDNGQGFKLSGSRPGIGISNITNRVESFNGTISIKSSPGKGCTFIIKIPYLLEE